MSKIISLATNSLGSSQQLDDMVTSVGSSESPIRFHGPWSNKTLNLPLVNTRTLMQKYEMVIQIEFMNISDFIKFIVFKQAYK
jgi:hypothetical protein